MGVEKDLSNLRAADLVNPKTRRAVERQLQKLYPDIDFSVDPAKELLANPETERVIEQLAGNKKVRLQTPRGKKH